MSRGRWSGCCPSQRGDAMGVAAVFVLLILVLVPLEDRLSRRGQRILNVIVVVCILGLLIALLQPATQN